MVDCVIKHDLPNSEVTDIVIPNPHTLFDAVCQITN